MGKYETHGLYTMVTSNELWYIYIYMISYQWQVILGILQGTWSILQFFWEIWGFLSRVFFIENQKPSSYWGTTIYGKPHVDKSRPRCMRHCQWSRSDRMNASSATDGQQLGGDFQELNPLVTGHLRNRFIGGSYHIYKAYFSGLCKGRYPQNMAKHMVLTYLHFRILGLLNWGSQEMSGTSIYESRPLNFGQSWPQGWSDSTQKTHWWRGKLHLMGIQPSQIWGSRWSSNNKTIVTGALPWFTFGWVG